MAEFSRREMLGAAAAGGVAAAATSTETSGQGQPPFGPTPAPLAGAELPSFRFRLGAVAPKTWDGGLGERGHGQGISRFASDRRSAHVACPGRPARAALACQRGG